MPHPQRAKTCGALPGVNCAKMDIAETWYECKQAIAGRNATMRVSLVTARTITSHGDVLQRRRVSLSRRQPPIDRAKAAALVEISDRRAK
jgi:hypothetical protein